MISNDTQERLDISASEDMTPWRLQFFAAGLFMVGLFTLFGMIMRAFQKELFFDVQVIALFMSTALFHRKAGWRVATLVIVPCYCMAVVPILFFTCTLPLMLEQDSKGVSVGWSEAFFFLGIQFLFGVWCIWVLTHSRVRQAFARSGQSESMVDDPQQADAPDACGAADTRRSA